MDLEQWTDLDLAYLLIFGTHPDLAAPSSSRAGRSRHVRRRPYPQAVILRGTTRPHNEPDAEPRELEAVCDTFEQGRADLHDQVPEGWDLLHITVDRV